MYISHKDNSNTWFLVYSKDSKYNKHLARGFVIFGNTAIPYYLKLKS